MDADLDPRTVTALRSLGCTCGPPVLVLGENVLVGNLLVTPLGIGHEPTCPLLDPFRRRAAAPFN